MSTTAQGEQRVRERKHQKGMANSVSANASIQKRMANSVSANANIQKGMANSVVREC